jgi:hypothetical protein
LGVDIDNKLQFLNTIHDKTIEKINNIVRFWSRFYLSLPGRINIVKTMCLSQISYVGCIITPSDAQMGAITDILEKFVCGKLSIGRDRLYSKLNQGGLGLINISSFIQAQQVLWIKRILYSACDNWREDIFNFTFGNPLILDPSLFNVGEHPILSMIAKSFVNFKREFFKENLNFRKSNLLLNPVLVRGQNDTRSLDRAFFAQVPLIEMEQLAKIKFNDFYKDGPISLANINQNLTFGVNLNLLTYMRLSEACRFSVGKLSKTNNGTNNGTCIGLSDFF